MGETSVIAVSIGDPAGVGPELILRAAKLRLSLRLPPFVAIGPRAALNAHAQGAKALVDLVECETPSDAANLPSGKLGFIETGCTASLTPGKLSKSGAKTAIAAIEAGVALVRSGDAAAIVTLPIHKANLKSIGFKYPGHTEFLAALSVKGTDQPAPMPVMMLAHGAFRVVPVTIHMPLKEVFTTLSEDLIVKTAEITAAALISDFGIEKPRLVLAGLNPHAGEDGELGKEDGALIRPAVKQLKAGGINAVGPLPADTMFHARIRATYDVALAMYHDQGLIPIKTIAFDEAVNITLGLPFVRTSPDHGTALDIAGKGIAHLDSFIAALRMADRLVKNRNG